MTVTYLEDAARGLIEGFSENGVQYQLNPAIAIRYKSSFLYNLETMTYSCESDAGIKSNGTLTRTGPEPANGVKTVELIDPEIKVHSTVRIEDASLKDSGERAKFETGAVRDIQTDKGRFDLLPAYAIKRLAKHFEKGSKKYGDRNWEKGIPLARYIDSGIRHLFCLLDGQQDEDHIAAALWNITCFIETQERIRRGVLPASLADGMQLPENLHKNPKEPT